MAKKSKGNYGEPIVTEPGVLQYVHVAEKDEKGKNASGKFGFRFLMSKKDYKKGMFDNMIEAIKEVGEVDDIDDLDKHPFCNKEGVLNDGDSEKNSKLEGHEGCIYINCYSDFEIETYNAIDQDEPVECDPSEIYAGGVARLILQPCMHDEGEVTFYPQAIMLVEEGEKFKGSRVDSKAMFASMGWEGSKSKSGSKKKKTETTSKKKSGRKKSEEKEETEVEEEEEGSEEEEEEKKTSSKKKSSKKRGGMSALLD